MLIVHVFASVLEISVNGRIFFHLFGPVFFISRSLNLYDLKNFQAFGRVIPLSERYS